MWSYIFAGIGMIFIGGQFLSFGIKQAAGTRLRAVFTTATKGRWRTVGIGILAGALLQSTNAVSFMASSLVGAGSLTVQAGSLLVAWCYVGTSVRLIAASVDSHEVSLVGLGLVGLGYFAGWDKDTVRKNWLTALLGVSLLMLGIETMIDGTAPFKSAAWLREVVLGADKLYPIGFIVGAALGILMQGPTMTIVVIGLVRAGLLDMDQAAIFVAGGILATGISAWWKSANLHGAERQLSILQLLLKIFATAVILPLLLVEHFFGIPTLVAASGMISNEASIRLMLLWWLGALLPAIMLVPINDWTVRLLARISPPTERESLVRPQYIFPQAAADPAGALELARLEQNRAFAVLPKMLEPVCEDSPGDVDATSLQSGAATLVAEIDHFLGVTMQSSSGENMTEAIMSAKYLNQVINELIDTASEICSLVLTIRKGAREIDIFSDLIEPLHAMLCEATDRMTAGGHGAAKVMLQLGKPRDDLFTELRTRVLTGSGKYTVQQKETFYKATRLSERMVWLIQRVGTSLAKIQSSSKLA